MYGKGVANPSYRQRTAHHAMLLGGMALITSALLVIANKQTYPDIELRRIEDMKRSLAQVIAPELHANDLLHDVIELKIKDEIKTIYVAKSEDNKVVAVAFKSSVKGYAGPIDVMVGIDRDGELLGTRILSHFETPGLGDKIEPEKDPWIFGFNGLSLNNPGESQWKVKKDGGYFDQFTGATITPRAVIKAVKASLEIFRSNKTLLLAGPEPQEISAPPQTQKIPDSEITINPENTQTTTHFGETLKGKSNG